MKINISRWMGTAAVVGVGLGASHAMAQCDPVWVHVSSIGPSPRAAHAMAYDSARDRVVLFGGFLGPGNGLSGETWEWDGVTWELRTTTGPTPRLGHRMTFDAARGVTLLHGGAIANSCGNQTSEVWTWDGSTWTNHAVAAPQNRQDHVMAYDPFRQRVVAFSGSTGCGFAPNDTWEWDGDAWSQIGVGGPASRFVSAAAFLPSRGSLVIFGGFAAPGVTVGDLWEWDGATWMPVPQGTPPPIRNSHAMAYDVARAKLVVVGGTDNDGPCGFFDTWEFDGTAWTEMDSGPGFPGVAGTAIAYDAARQHVVMFGGNINGCTQRSGDTWVWTAKPVLTSKPASLLRCTSATNADFAVTAAGSGPFTYQWRRGGVNLANGPTGTGSTLVGVTTPSLQIQNASIADDGAYDCVVTNACGSATSAAATLTTCYPDCDCNGALSIDDFICFQTLFAIGDPYADCDADSVLSIDDFICFQTYFAIGC